MDTKYDRQRRKQQAAVSVLCRDPSLLGDGRLRGRLQVIAGQVAGQAYRDSISRWSELLSSGDVGAVSRAVLDDTATGAYLRNTSPLGVLLTPQEREDAIRGRMPAET
ncbi:MAG: hypothetical protein KDB70_08875 [Mycobacterium sp.]|nr:hypothetical protein [Mycobacterium sp.]